MDICFIPFYEHFLCNQLFQDSNTWTSHWQEANIAFYDQCQQLGHTVGTWDILPIEQSDVIVFQDYPKTLQAVIDVKKRAPNARIILMLYETPLSNPHWFDKRNHHLFDAVLTYNAYLVDNKKYFRLYLPIGMPPKMLSETPFERRHPMAMVNTNRYGGLLSSPRPWHYWRKFQEIKKSGWRCTLPKIMRSRLGDLNHHRRHLARVAEKYYPETLQIFGKGWDGQDSGWFRRFFPEQPYKLSQGIADTDKLELLGNYRFAIAYENYQGNVNYISEKIFDALYAGVVPVYLGDANIAADVWSDCFIDRRDFKSDIALLDFVNSCPERKWKQLKDAGKAYLQSTEIKLFQPQHYTDTLLQAITEL